MAITYRQRLLGAAGILSVVAVAASPVLMASAVTDTSTVSVTVGSTISVSATDTVSFSVTPVAGGALSSDSDVVSVSTNATAGYTLSVSSSDTSNLMTSGGNTIAASSNTYASPAALENNRWGYAVPGAPFDASYATETNAEGSVTEWAGMPVLASLQAIKTTAVPTGGDNTTVWYAVEATSSQPNGTYTEAVTYTATANP